MSPMSLNYSDFLHWLKDHTENHWNQDPQLPLGQRTCPQWACGAKWIGMTDKQIDQVQQKYSITFTPEHREFLRIMHTVDRKARDYVYLGKEKGEFHERSFFRNWLEDDEEIKTRLTAAYDWMIEDVRNGNGLWLKSWGQQPSDPEERVRVFSSILAKAPQLVPVTSHRYQVTGPSFEQRPVLSTIGFDIVWYGGNFRHYLWNELQPYLDIWILNEDHGEPEIWDPQVKEMYTDCFEYYDETKLPAIPFWRSLVVYDRHDHSKNDHL